MTGSILEMAGAANKIVARAGEFGNPPDGAAGAAVASVPVVTQDTPTLEPIIAAKPDLVVSYGLFKTKAEDLDGAGITSMVLSGYCGNDGSSSVGDGQRFDDLTKDLQLFGRIFGTSSTTSAAVAKLNSRIDAVRAAATPHTGQSAVACYFVGGKGPYVYGNVSITTAQMQVFGLHNAFPDAGLQDPALSVEAFLAANPDWLILIYGYDKDETPSAAKDKLLALPGANNLAAVKAGRIVTMQGPRAEPSPVAVDGLEELAAGFARIPG